MPGSMMRAERDRRSAPEQDLAWLLRGPADSDVVENDEEQPARLLAAE